MNPNDVFDLAAADETGLRGLDDGQLERERILADVAQRTAQTNYDAAVRDLIPGMIQDRHIQAELAAGQALNLARLHRTQVEGEIIRRRDWAERDAAQRAALERAANLAAQRAQAWSQYVIDAGVNLDGASMANPEFFERIWQETVVRNAILETLSPG